MASGEQHRITGEAIRRARRRRAYSLVGMVAVFCLAVGVLGPLFGSHGHGDHSAARSVIGIIVPILLIVGSAAFLYRMRSNGRLTPLAVNGLPRDERRRAVDAVRRGEPSSEPALQAIEQDLAQRAAAQNPAALILLVAAVALVAAVTVIYPGLLNIGLGAVIVAVLAWLVVQHVRLARGARR